LLAAMCWPLSLVHSHNPHACMQGRTGMQLSEEVRNKCDHARSPRHSLPPPYTITTQSERESFKVDASTLNQLDPVLPLSTHHPCSTPPVLSECPLRHLAHL
jgi:hypothetical protein